VREKQGPHDSRISQLRAKIVAKRVASQIKGQRDKKAFTLRDWQEWLDVWVLWMIDYCAVRKAGGIGSLLSRRRILAGSQEIV
jgi:hypothetical protein